MKKALIIIAAAFLLFNIYQAIVSTIFISHFPFIINQLPNFIKSSQLALQLTLFLLQETVATIGSYMRLIGAVFAFNCAILFFKGNPKYIKNLRRALLFEALYYLLLVPAGINHVVGSIISTSAFLNLYTGVSFLLQAALISPSLFILSTKLKKPQNLPPILKWAGIAGTLYIFGLWIRQALMWVYAILPSKNPQTNLINVVGAVNSLLTLLVAAVVATVAWLTFRKTKKINTWMTGTAILLVGVYFVIYGLISVWVPIYLAFLPLIDFWMTTLTILGITILLRPKSKIESRNKT